MKKLLILAAVAVLILGLSAATYAVEFKASGFFNFYTALGVNLCNFPGPPPGPDDPDATTNTGFNDTYAYNNLWSHLDFTMEASEDLKGHWGLEAGPHLWGVTPGNAGWYPGTTVNLYHAYIDFKVPGTDAFPTRALVGVQSWVFSPKFAIFEYGPGVRFNTTAGPASISLFWRKHDENVMYQSDDFDSYGASFGMPAGPITTQVWSIYYLQRTGAARADLPAYLSDPEDPAFVAAFNADAYLWYTGVNVAGKFGIVDIAGDFVFATGKVDYNLPYMETATFGLLSMPALRSGEDFTAWVGRATASVPLGMVTVGGEFMYGTGRDDQDWEMNREWSGYRIPPAATGGINVSLIGDAALVYYRSYSHVWPGYTSNPGDDWYIRGFANLKPLDWLTVRVNGLYIADNVENGDRFGDSVNFLGVPEDNDDAGIEVDVFTDIQIYPNLKLTVAGGYLFAGSALDRQVPGSAAYFGLPANINESPKNPYVIVTNLSYFF